MSRRIVGIVLPDTPETNALFIADIKNAGLVVYIFFSREQGLDLLQENGNWSDDGTYRNCIRDIRDCGLPHTAEKERIFLAGDTALAIVDAIDCTGHEARTPAHPPEPRMPGVRVFAFILKPNGGVLSLMDRGTHHVYAFSSKSQASLALESHRLRMNPEDFAAYKKQIGPSILSAKESHPLVHVSGFIAEMIAVGFEHHLLMLYTRSRLRTPC